MMALFDEQYPNITGWIQDGWIEMGQDEYSTSFIRVLDAGGLVWESKSTHETVAAALAEADKAIGQWEDA